MAPTRGSKWPLFATLAAAASAVAAAPAVQHATRAPRGRLLAETGGAAAWAGRGKSPVVEGIPPAVASRDMGEGLRRYCFGFCGGGGNGGRGPCGDVSGFSSAELCGGRREGSTEWVVELGEAEAGDSAVYTTTREAIPCPPETCEAWGEACTRCSALPAAMLSASEQAEAERQTGRDVRLAVLATIFGCGGLGLCCCCRMLRRCAQRRRARRAEGRALGSDEHVGLIRKPDSLPEDTAGAL